MFLRTLKASSAEQILELLVLDRNATNNTEPDTEQIRMPHFLHLFFAANPRTLSQKRERLFRNTKIRFPTAGRSAPESRPRTPK